MNSEASQGVEGTFALGDDPGASSRAPSARGENGKASPVGCCTGRRWGVLLPGAGVL